jgi:hypothetical protein
MEDEIGFVIVMNYPAERKFIIKKPLKKSFLDSAMEMISGR